MKFTLPAREPFKFMSVVRSHGWHQLAPFSFDESSKTLSDVMRLSNIRVIEVKLSDGNDRVIVETEKLNKLERTEVTDAVTWMFGLDMDFSAFYAASRAEPKVAHVKKQALGRVLRSPTLFEDVIKTILTTNTLWGATKNMTQRLVEEFGATLGRDTQYEARNTYHTFPTPEAIAASNPEYYQGENSRRLSPAPSIHELATRIAKGQFDLEALKTSSLPTLELRKEMMTINGVGPYGFFR